jgi:hypothetical protein
MKYVLEIRHQNHAESLTGRFRFIGSYSTSSHKSNAGRREFTVSSEFQPVFIRVFAKPDVDFHPLNHKSRIARSSKPVKTFF